MTALPNPHPQPWHDHRVIVFAGMYESHTATGEDYRTRALAELFNVKPVCTPKLAGPAFIPSSYADFDARSHTVQRERGAFVALTADIDQGDHPLGAIVEVIRLIAADTAHLVYASPHSRPCNRRWRVIVPLAEPEPYINWHDAQTALCDHLEAHDIVPDRALCRPAQPVFLPNVPRRYAVTGEALRGTDSQPLYFEWQSTGTAAPGLSLDHGAMGALVACHARRRALADDERARRQAAALRRPVANSDDPVRAFNGANALPDLLTRYGYEPRPGQTNHWRSPYQQGATYGTRVMGAKWCSLSASDTAAGLGARHDAGCFGDGFDLFAHFEHGGDRRAAFRALMQEARG